MAADGFRKSWLQARESQERCQKSLLLLCSVKGYPPTEEESPVRLTQRALGRESSVRRIIHQSWSERSGESPDSSTTSRILEIKTNNFGLVSLHMYHVSDSFFFDSPEDVDLSKTETMPNGRDKHKFLKRCQDLVYLKINARRRNQNKTCRMLSRTNQRFQIRYSTSTRD
jgi:hypothetical protein